MHLDVPGLQTSSSLHQDSFILLLILSTCSTQGVHGCQGSGHPSPTPTPALFPWAYRVPFALCCSHMQSQDMTLHQYQIQASSFGAPLGTETSEELLLHSKPTYRARRIQPDMYAMQQADEVLQSPFSAAQRFGRWPGNMTFGPHRCPRQQTEPQLLPSCTWRWTQSSSSCPQQVAKPALHLHQ